jgi:hypothetical protein
MGGVSNRAIDSFPDQAIALIYDFLSIGKMISFVKFLYIKKYRQEKTGIFCYRQNLG